MTLFQVLPFAAAVCAWLLAAARLVRTPRPPAAWWFVAGMVLLGLDSTFTSLSLGSATLDGAVSWLERALTVKCLVAVAWLGFGLSYSRGNAREALARWRVPLGAAALLSVGLALGFPQQLLDFVPAAPPDAGWVLRFGVLGTALNLYVLVALVLVLVHLEQTFRAAVGTMRWRIKFVVIGLAVILGTRLYVASQGVLFSAPDLALAGLESSALLIGCALLAVAYARTGLAEVEVHPSAAVLRSSLTILLAGAYLLIVGVLGRMAEQVGGAHALEFRSFVVLLGLAGLAVLLLSDRVRRWTHGFVARHFRRAEHDAAAAWTLLSQRLATVKDERALCAASARLVSETFGALSVTVWLVDEASGHLRVSASTTGQAGASASGAPSGTASNAVASGLGSRTSPFDLDSVRDDWAVELRRLNPATFATGGRRWCVPLRAGDQSLGAMVLADRVGGAAYTGEELELLACIGSQTASVLENLRLGGEVTQARELDAFRTMSAFFVHDLKNTAASLNLMLKNLPVHFDDPAFRADALRTVGNTARRIDELIAGLSALRDRPPARPVDTDLNQLVRRTLERVGSDMPGVELTAELQPLPAARLDPEQIEMVVANLVLNARDAVTGGGRVRVRTEHRDGRIVLSVADNGTGMSPEFVRDALFRPFQSTKRRGLGIGLFQSKRIVEAHGGRIAVESAVGVGTTFLVSFPASGTDPGAQQPGAAPLSWRSGEERNAAPSGV
jgi:putative PEP-CTERM system histidine kinase